MTTTATTAATAAPKFYNLGSLITYKDEQGADVALGYLMTFDEMGVYDATIGKVDVSTKNAHTHNELLDAGSVCMARSISGSPTRPSVRSWEIMLLQRR